MSGEIVNYSADFTERLSVLETSSSPEKVADSLAKVGATFLAEIDGKPESEQTSLINGYVESINKVLSLKRDSFKINKGVDDIAELVTETAVVADIVSQINQQIRPKAFAYGIGGIKLLLFSVPQPLDQGTNEIKKLYFYGEVERKTLLQDSIDNRIRDRISQSRNTLFRGISNINPEDVQANEVTSVLDSAINLFSTGRRENSFKLADNIRFQVKVDSIVEKLRSSTNTKIPIIKDYISLLSDIASEANVSRDDAINAISRAANAIFSNTHINVIYNRLDDYESIYYQVLLVNFTSKTLDKVFLNQYSAGRNNITKDVATKEVLSIFNLGKSKALRFIERFFDINNDAKREESLVPTRSVKNSEGEFSEVTGFFKDILPDWYKEENNQQVSHTLGEGIEIWGKTNEIDIRKLQEEVENDIKRRRLLPDVFLDPFVALNKEKEEPVEVIPEGDIQEVNGFEKYVNKLLSRFDYGQDRQKFEDVSKTVAFLIQSTYSDNSDIAELARLNLVILAESFHSKLRAICGKNSYGNLNVLTLLMNADGRKYLSKLTSEMADFLMIAKFGKLKIKDPKGSGVYSGEVKINDFLSNVKIDFTILNSSQRGLGGIVDRVNTSINSILATRKTDNETFFSNAFKYGNNNPKLNFGNNAPSLVDSVESKIKFILSLENDRGRDRTTVEMDPNDLYNSLRNEATEITYSSIESSVLYTGDTQINAPMNSNSARIVEEYSNTFYRLSLGFAPFIERLALFASGKNPDGLFLGNEKFANACISNEGRNKNANVAYASLVNLFFKVIDAETIKDTVRFLNMLTQVTVGETNQGYNLQAYKNYSKTLNKTRINYNVQNAERNFVISEADPKSENGPELDRPYPAAELMSINAIINNRYQRGNQPAFIWKTEDVLSHNIGNSILQRLDAYMKAFGYCVDKENDFDRSLVSHMINTNARQGNVDFTMRVFAKWPTYPGKNSPVPVSLIALMTASTSKSNWNIDKDNPFADKYILAYDPLSIVNKVTHDEVLSIVTDSYFSGNNSDARQFSDIFSLVEATDTDVNGNIPDKYKNHLFPNLRLLANVRELDTKSIAPGKAYRGDAGKDPEPELTLLKRVSNSIWKILGLFRENASDILKQSAKNHGSGDFEDVVMAIFKTVGSVQKEAINKHFMFATLSAWAYEIQMSYDQIKANVKKDSKENETNPLIHLRKRLAPQGKDIFKGPIRMEEFVMGVTTKVYSFVMRSVKEVTMSNADKYLFEVDKKDRIFKEALKDACRRKNVPMEGEINYDRNIHKPLIQDISKDLGDKMRVEVFSLLEKKNEMSRNILAAYLHFREYIGFSKRRFKNESGLVSTKAYIDPSDNTETTDLVYTTGLEALFQYMRRIVSSPSGIKVVNDAMRIIGNRVVLDNRNSLYPPVLVVDNPTLIQNPNYKPIITSVGEEGCRIDPWSGMQIIKILVEELPEKTLLRSGYLVAEKEVLNKIDELRTSNQNSEADRLESDNALTRISILGLDRKIKEITTTIEGIYGLIENINVDLGIVPVLGTNRGATYIREKTISFKDRYASVSAEGIQFTDIIQDLWINALFANAVLKGKRANLFLDSTEAFKEMYSRTLSTKYFSLMIPDALDPRVNPDITTNKQYGVLESLRSRMNKSKTMIQLYNLKSGNQYGNPVGNEVLLDVDSLDDFAECVTIFPEKYATVFPNLIFKDGNSAEYFFDIELLLIEPNAMLMSGICMPQKDRENTIVPNIETVWADKNVQLASAFTGEKFNIIREASELELRRVPTSARYIEAATAIGEIWKKNASGDFKTFCQDRGITEQELYNLVLSSHEASIPEVVRGLRTEILHTNFIRVWTKSIERSMTVLKEGGKAGSFLQKGIKLGLDILDDFIPLSVTGMSGVLASLPITVGISYATSMALGAVNPGTYILGAGGWQIAKAGIMLGACAIAGIPRKTTAILTIANLFPWDAASIFNPGIQSILIGNFLEKRLVQMGRDEGSENVLWRIINRLSIITTGNPSTFRERIASTVIDKQTKDELKFKGSVGHDDLFDPATIKQRTGVTYPYLRVRDMLNPFGDRAFIKASARFLFTFGLRGGPEVNHYLDNLVLLLSKITHFDDVWNDASGAVLTIGGESRIAKGDTKKNE